MIKLLAEITKDQELLDKFQHAYENLKKIVDRLEDENMKLTQDLQEYKKASFQWRVKNGKTYDISVAWDAQPENIIP